jgi:hypothetical protein
LTVAFVVKGRIAFVVCLPFCLGERETRERIEMDFKNKLIEALDEEIARLTRVKNMLTVGTIATVTNHNQVSRSRKNHIISPEGRARIAAAQKKRWAKQRRMKADGIHF